MMKAHPPVGKAQRAGAACGRAWQGWLRQEKRLIAWGVTQGVPAALGQTLLWVVKLLLIGALFFLAFWVVLLVLFATVAAWAAKNQDYEEKQEPEWREGFSGYGLYNQDGDRIDPGGIDDE